MQPHGVNYVSSFAHLKSSMLNEFGFANDAKAYNFASVKKHHIRTTLSDFELLSLHFYLSISHTLSLSLSKSHSLWIKNRPAAIQQIFQCLS